jgi:PhoPQ-activated pathogenicity-related protein
LIIIANFFVENLNTSQIIKKENYYYIYKELKKHAMKKPFFFILLILFFTACEVLFVEDISNDVVRTLAPLENSEVTSGTVSFSWQLIDEADSYQIQIATPTFQNANQIVLDSISEANSVQKNLEAGEYQWRIKAINAEYETNYTTVSFTVNE